MSNILCQLQFVKTNIAAFTPGGGGGSSSSGSSYKSGSSSSGRGCSCRPGIYVWK